MNTYLLVLVSFAFTSHGKLTFLAMGDWGGQDTSPYSTHEEVATAKYMGAIATAYNASFGFGIGDNFYSYGIKNEYDKRFQETFEDVFTAHSLEFPWYMVAGNHDHRGNVTGQIYYSNHSHRWNFPDLYYTKIFDIPGTSRKLQVLMIDTVQLVGQTTDAEYCVEGQECVLHPKGPEDPVAAANQWGWIQSTLRGSTADYVVVMGHYPIYSIAEHGPTAGLIKDLKPMLQNFKATAYFCGHDHTLEYLQESGSPLGYVVTGGAHDCDPSTAHTKSVPAGSLKYHGCGDGGFVKVDLDDSGMTVEYYLGKGGPSVFKTPTFKPRK